MYRYVIHIFIPSLFHNLEHLSLNYGETICMQQNWNMSLVCFLLAFLILQVSLVLQGVEALSSPKKWTQNWIVTIYEFKVSGEKCHIKKCVTKQTGTEGSKENLGSKRALCSKPTAHTFLIVPSCFCECIRENKEY